MSENTIEDLINLGWEDEKIKQLTGCEDKDLERMRKQVKENEKLRQVK